MLFIGSPSNSFFRLKKMRNFGNLFLRLEEFGNICVTNFCDLGPKSQKFVPQKLMLQHFISAKINALKVTGGIELNSEQNTEKREDFMVKVL